MKLYVGNLSFTSTEDSIRNKFEEFGAVQSVTIIKDRDTNRSKGFGFVEMADNNAGQAAIDQLNQQEFEGRRVVVNEARPRPEGGQQSRRPYNGGGSRGGHDRNDRRW